MTLLFLLITVAAVTILPNKFTNDRAKKSNAENAWSVPFLGRTPSEPIRLANCANVTISGKQFENVNGVAIAIENCDNVTITENDFASVTGAIFVLNSTNVNITWNRYRNIGNGTVGSGYSNFVQFNKTIGGYIAYNKGIGGHTEDIISIYQSGGASTSSPLIIEYNQFEGTDWTSNSGSGLMLGDDGGHNIIARYNKLLTAGQVGIGVASGTDIHITDNILYGTQRTGANVGLSVWNQYPRECSGIEVARNQVRWYRQDGAENPYWNAGNCGPVSGESTNNIHANIDPSSLAVVLESGSTVPTTTPNPTPTIAPTLVLSDTINPTVFLTTPGNGVTVGAKSSVNITASATDNVGVSRVEFLVNGTFTCTDTSSPYTCSWKVPAARNKSYTLSAKAYDSAGNNSTSSVTVTAR